MSEPTSVLNTDPNDELFAELADDFVRRLALVSSRPWTSTPTSIPT